MKIVGGSFGVKGKARLSGDYFEVLGERQAEYRPGDLAAVNVRQEGERKFGFFGALVGGAILAYIIGIVLGPLGWLLGFAIAIAGSFYSTKKYYADIDFADGAKLHLETNDHESKRLIQFRSR